MSHIRTGIVGVLESCSPAVRKLNQHLVAGAVLPEPYPVGDAYAVPQKRKEGAKRRLRQQSGDGLNKTERAFFSHLKATHPNADHYPQAWSLRLANGASYRPDFISIWDVIPSRVEPPLTAISVTAWETKGFKREASAVRIKVAAAKYPAIKFMLVTRRRKIDGGGWDIEEVKS